MIHGARGAVAIHYDDSKPAFHCPHCGQEFFPDDVLCISCGYEFADEKHPYGTPWIRPCPVLDVTGSISAADQQVLAEELGRLRDSLGMEVLLAVLPAHRERPPAEIAWFYTNCWQVGGVTSPRDFPIPPPVPEAPIEILKALGHELAQAPKQWVKSLQRAPDPGIDLPGLGIFVFPEYRTITLEPTIAAEGRFAWGGLAEGLKPIVARMGEDPLAAICAQVIELLAPPPQTTPPPPTPLLAEPRRGER